MWQIWQKLLQAYKYNGRHFMWSRALQPGGGPGAERRAGPEGAGRADRRAAAAGRGRARLWTKDTSE